jgi:signal transduction histidine kinase/CheY-like chemotaxis protein/CHASE1-domain containing sensor protein
MFKNFFNYLYEKKLFGILSIGFMFIAVISWISLSSSLNKNINYRLERELKLVTAALNSNVQNFANTLSYVNAYFKVEGIPNPETFKNLAQSIQNHHINQGRQSIGYIKIIRKNEVSKFKKENADLLAENLEKLKEGKELYAPIKMIAPLNEVRAKRLGIDMLEEETRRVALLHAIHKSGITISSPILPLVIKNPNPYGAVMLLFPYYDTPKAPPTPELRLAHVRGVIYIPMSMRDFFNSTLGAPSFKTEKVNFSVAYINPQNAEEKIMYQRFDVKPDDGAIIQSQTMEVYGQKWKITIHTLPQFFNFGERYLADIFIAGFFVFVILLYSIFRQTQNLLNKEKQAKQLVTESMVKSKQQTAKLKRLNRINVQKDLDTEISHIIQDFFNATLPVSESSHVVLFCGSTLDNPYIIPFHQAEGFPLYAINTEEITVLELHKLLGKNVVRKNDKGAEEIFYHFIKAEDKFVDWIIVVLPSREFRGCGLLFLGREKGTTYSDIDIEIIENMVSQFGIRIDNTRLFKKVEDANKMKTAFLSNMSHEIRTPLNAIAGFAEMIETVEPEKRHTLIEGIQKNTTQLTSIIDNILDISKIEFGRIFINKKRVSLSLLVKSVENTMAFHASEKGLVFEIKSKGLLPAEIETDESRVKQILINLIGNAIKFTDKGSIRMDVQYDGLLSSNASIIFNIIDSGIGISEPSQMNLFQSFNQIDVSSTRRFGGLGLGLALSFRLAQQFGGEVKLIESRLNNGSVFQLKIPCGNLNSTPWLGLIYEDIDHGGNLMADSDQLQLNTQTHLMGDLVPTDVTEQLSLENKKILIVEDSEDNQEIFKFFLQAAGARIDVADNGADAVKKASSDNYDLILMDIQLPIMDGLEATRRIRTAGYTKPIIALTAHSSSEEKSSCLKAGCIGLITKPVTQIALIHKIKTIQEEFYVSR